MYSPSVIDRHLLIPNWCYEDTPVEYLRRTREGYDCDISYEEYRELRRKSYYACVWYPKLINEKIPVIDSVLVSLQDLQQAMIDYPDYKFVRTCGSSPKDLGDCIYNTYEAAHKALMQSRRTLDIFSQAHYHILLREVVKIEVECRCFVHQRKLRAVSIYCYLNNEELEMFKESLVEFFELYGDKLPYNSAVVEVCKVDDFPMIVEFNSFGVDQYSGASLFDWDEDKEILYNSTEPVFRMPGEFEWT